MGIHHTFYVRCCSMVFKLHRMCIAPSVWVTFLSYSGIYVSLHMQCEVV